MGFQYIHLFMAHLKDINNVYHKLIFLFGAVSLAPQGYYIIIYVFPKAEFSRNSK